MAADGEAGVGIGGWCGGAERVVVADCGGSDCLYIKGKLWASLVRFLVESVSKSLGIRQTISRIRGYALVSFIIIIIIIILFISLPLS